MTSQANLMNKDENNVYANGVMDSFLRLLLYLVEKCTDRQTTIFYSELWEIETDMHANRHSIF